MSERKILGTSELLQPKNSLTRGTKESFNITIDPITGQDKPTIKKSRSIYLPSEGSDRAVIKIDKQEYKGEIITLDKLRELHANAGMIFSSPDNTMQYIQPTIHSSVNRDGEEEFVFYERYRPDLYEAANDNGVINFCKMASLKPNNVIDEDQKYKIWSELVRLSSSPESDPQEVYDFYVLHFPNAIEILNTLDEGSLSFRSLTNFLRKSRKYQEETGLFLDLTGGKNVVLKPILSDQGVIENYQFVINNSSVKWYYSVEKALEELKKFDFKNPSSLLRNFILHTCYMNTLSYFFEETPNFSFSQQLLNKFKSK